ncbi:MAG: galactokinase [Sediminibacterium sp.]
MIVAEIKKIFQEQFQEEGIIVRSPGRINLIGEHTDYNLGFVLPAAIDKAIYIAINKRSDKEIHLYAADLDQFYQTELFSLEHSSQQWPNYILGVVDQLVKAEYALTGFNAVVMGDVPLGAGLSSSAAVECATVFALNTLFDLGIDKKNMVLYSQKAENEYVGLKCGVMDQFASMFGKKENVIRLDCRSLEYAYMPFDTRDISILLFDTGVKHSLASTEYNLRRQECEEGVRIIQKKYPQVQSLRDSDNNMVNECLAGGNDVVFRRCKFMVEEIQRLLDACTDLINHDMVAFGKKMFLTHDGLSQLYEVSCPEADGLVNMVRNNEAVLGARMMGGGFGGCTINIVQKGKAETLTQEVAIKYKEQFNRDLKTYLVTIDDGTSLA